MSKTIWQALDWDCHPNIEAGFTLKNDEFEQSFSLAKHAFENNQQQQIEQVDNNRETLLSALNLNKPVIWLNQTHSNICVAANIENLACNADASFCNTNESVCAVLTADCLPIYLADKQGKEVAMVHGGWRGLLNGVIQNAIAKFKSSHIQAYLGAAIGEHAFEVGIEVKALFIEQSSQFESAFMPEHKPGKTMANIYEIARVILKQNNVEDVQGGQFCTVNETRFFSYRNGDITGRMAHLIWIK